MPRRPAALPRPARRSAGPPSSVTRGAAPGGPSPADATPRTAFPRPGCPVPPSDPWPPPKTDPYRTAGRATPELETADGHEPKREYRALPRTGPPQWQRIGQRAIMARCHRVSRRSLRATVRVAAADAERTSEANTRSTRPTRMTESPREMSGWFWSAVDASGFTSGGTSGSLNGRASRHRTGPRRSGANVRLGSRRLKRPNVISVCSWTKCIRLWTTTFVYSPPSPRGPSLTAHHSCLELTPRLASRRNYVVSAPTAE